MINYAVTACSFVYKDLFRYIYSKTTVFTPNLTPGEKIKYGTVPYSDGVN